MAFAVFLAVGCGDAAKDEVTRTVRTYYLAVSRGDDRTACRQVTGDYRRAVRRSRDLGGPRGKSCAVIPSAFQAFFDRPLGDKDLEVEVGISENRAAATARLSQRRAPGTPEERVIDRLVLQESNGTWKIIGRVH